MRGYGTRLGNLTKEIPKPMLPIMKKPLLEYIINYLKTNGIDEIGINLHYKPEIIEKYFSDGASLGIKITYTYEKELLGTAGALIQFEDFIRDNDFLVIYGDIITDQNLKPLFDLHKKNRSFATLLIHKNLKSNSFLEINKHNRIISFIERPQKKDLESIKIENCYSNSAVQILSNDVLKYIKQNQAFDLPKDVYINCYQNKIISAYPLETFRIAVDSEDRYKQVSEIIKSGKVKW